MNINDYCIDAGGHAELRRPLEAFMHDDIVSDDPEILRQLKLIERTAASNAPILIEGEKGTGKEMFAQYAFTRSSRADKRYIRFNSATIPRERCGTELFGTGRAGAAAQAPASVLRYADGGTLFLNDVDLLPADIQNRLAETLSGHTEDGMSLDIRLIAALSSGKSTPDMCEGISENLYYYLNVIRLTIPPLRERPQDIVLLSMFFVNRIRTEYHLNRRLGFNVLTALAAFDWPNNTRQLKNAIERIMWLSESEVIDDLSLLSECLPDTTVRKNAGVLPFVHDTAFGDGRSLKEIVSEYELFIINQYIDRYGSIRKAAEALQVAPSSLSRKLNME